MDCRRLDIVIPLFNEEEIVESLHRRVVAAAQQSNLDWRIVYVDDGSQDATVGRLIESKSEIDRVEIIELSRNFGQPAAILAGLDASDADAVVLMDGDLQDPPELIPKLVEKWLAGNNVVIARREKRMETSRSRSLAFRGFHRLFAWLSDLEIPSDCGTFCLMSREAVTAIREMPESHRFFPGLRAWVGFRQTIIDYERPARLGGEPKQTLRRLIRYAGDAIFGFSRKPVPLLCMSGGILLAGAFLVFTLAIIAWMSSITSGIGWTAVGCGLSAVAGLQLLSTGLLAEVVFRIHEQVKQRPPYLIARRTSSASRSVLRRAA